MQQFPNYSQMNNPYMQAPNPYMERMNFLQGYQQNLQQPIQQQAMSSTSQHMNIIGKIERTIEAYIQYLPSVKGLLKRKQTSI